MGCCISSDDYAEPNRYTELQITEEIIMENSRYVPYHHLNQKPRASLTMNDPRTLKLQHQIDQHAKLLSYQTQIPLHVRTQIEKITRHLLTNNGMNILNTWGVIFEFGYQPVWTLKVAPTDKNPETRLVLLVDIDSIIHAGWGFHNGRRSF